MSDGVTAPAAGDCPPDFSGLSACPGCDLLVEKVTVPAGHVARCPRCGNKLWSPKTNALNNTLAISASGLLLYLPAMFLPLMTLDTVGMQESANIVDGVVGFYRGGYGFVALIVLLTSILFPLMRLSLLFYTSLLLRMGRCSRKLPLFFRLYCHLNEWGMVEVYLIGILVTIIKVYQMAHITYGTGFFCFIGLVMATIGTSVVIDEDLFWQRIEAKRSLTGHSPQKEPTAGSHGGGEKNASEAGLVLCHGCHKLLPLIETTSEKITRCPRCDAALHIRKYDSINRTWALVLSSMILFVPANMLPIMRVDTLGSPQSSTIMDGIIYFFKEGSYGIGVVILSASILVPLFKIIGLLMILLSVRFHWKSWLRHKAEMFRFIEFIGRWSMLDIYVIALLGVLINFGVLTTIHAAPAATYFAAVVLSTMFAAISFDPRILWDHCA